MEANTQVTAQLFKPTQNFKLMAYPTNPIYKFTKNSLTSEIEAVKITVNGVEFFIPLDEANRHYQEYLKWVAEGNTAEAADQTGQFIKITVE